MNTIPRKAVGQQPPTGSAASAAAPEFAPQGKEASTPRKLKRMSSISSILSAYSSASNISQDSAHRSSQGSVATKDSEPSLSPERDAADPRAKLFATLGDYTGNPHEDELTSAKDQTENEQQQSRPPVPAKDTKRGGSPTLGLPANRRGGLPATPRSAKALNGEPAPSSTTPAPATLHNTSPLTGPATPQTASPLPKSNGSETISSATPAPANGRVTPPLTRPHDPEAASSSPSASANGTQPLWQRRASKSDASIKVPDLTLTVSHGSTGSTTLTSQPLDGPPVPSKSESSSTTRPSPLPPKSSSGLPGRNIRPAPPPPTKAPASKERDEDEEMKKLAASVRAVAKWGSGSGSPKQEENKAPTSGPSPSIAHANDVNMQKGAVAEKRSQDFVSPMSSAEVRPSSQRNQQGASQAATGRPSTAQNSDGRDQPSPSQMPRDGQSMPRQRGDMPRSNEQQPMKSPMGPIVSHQRSHEQLEQQPQALANQKSYSSLDETSPTSTPGGRRLLAPNGAPAPRTRPSLSMVGEEVSFTKPTPLTHGQQTELASAIMLFRRHDRPIADEYPVINAPPLRPCHLQCLGDHQGFIRTKNAVHSIACATCHAEDRDPRYVCTTCSVRVCLRCRDLLEKHKDTGVVLDLIQGGGVQAAGETVGA
ncbi:hypothetical protein PG996_001127 [Apiospora saccharicola]|uniref:B box-type domain-containing protein n=1 Tax=Apiospora saccharicola TaxID=335842 RepID=A0ABR1WFT4_9PEZI